MSAKYNVILEAATLATMKPGEIIEKLKRANYEDAETAANGDILLAHDVSFMESMEVEQKLSQQGLQVKVREVGYVEPEAKAAAEKPSSLTEKDSYKVGGVELSLEPTGDEQNKPKTVGSLRPCPKCGFRQMPQLQCIKCSAPMDG